MIKGPDRWEGKRYYDREADESFTVLTSRDNASGLVETQYDDGLPWDEMALPEDVTEQGAEQFGLEEGGLDSERYVPIGCGPTIRRSRELCGGDHDWFPLPSHLGWDDPDVWYEGIDAAAEDLGVTLSRPVDLYNLIARCKRCGLSANSILTFTDNEIPDVCMECGIELIPGETQGMFLADLMYCPDCADRLRETELTCAECDRTFPKYTGDGSAGFRFVTPETYTQKHDAFEADFDEGETPICIDCWQDTVQEVDPS